MEELMASGFGKTPWAYCERSGRKTRLSDLVHDVSNGQGAPNVWVQRGWADGVHPQSQPKSIGPDLMQLEPITAGEAQEEWLTTLGNIAYPNVTSGFAKTAVRIVISGGTGGAIGVYLRLRLTAPASAPLRISAAYLGNANAITPYAFASVPTRITMGTVGDFVIPAGQTLATDRMLMTLAASLPVVLAFDVASASVASGPAVPGVTIYSKSNAQESWAQSVTGYGVLASTSVILAGLDILGPLKDDSIYWGGSGTLWGNQQISWGPNVH
jgi:hypothetical protein